MNTKLIIGLLLLALVPLRLAAGGTPEDEGVSKGAWPNDKDLQQGQTLMQEAQAPRARLEALRGSQVDRKAEAEIRANISAFLNGSANGDAEQVVDIFAKPVRDRIEKSEGSYSSFTGLSESFTQRWEDRYQASFSQGLGDTTLPFQFKQQDQNRMRVTLGGDASANLTLDFVRVAGILGNSWKLDVSGVASKAEVASKLKAAVDDLQRNFSWPQERSQAYLSVAASLLRPFSAKA